MSLLGQIFSRPKGVLIASTIVKAGWIFGARAVLP